MKIPTSLTARSWRRPLPMRSAEEIGWIPPPKLREIIEKDVGFSAGKGEERDDQKDLPAGIPGTSH